VTSVEDQAPCASTQELQRLKACHRQALTLWEQLSAGEIHGSDGYAYQIWRERVAGGKSSVFRKRLRMAGLDPKRCMIHGDSSSRRLHREPQSNFYRTHSGRSEGSAVESNATLLTAFLDRCGTLEVSSLCRDLKTIYPLNDTALGSLNGLLHQRLMQISVRLIVHEFGQFKRQRCARSFRDDVRFLSSERNSALAQEFLTLLIDQGIPYLRESYPVWARLVDEEISRWYQAARELLSRLSDDQPSLSEVCGIERYDELSRIEGGGDRHRGGRCVLILTFVSGKKVVYKPRSLSLDEWYRDLLTWLTSLEGCSLDLRAPQVIDRSTYGWAEYIKHELIDDAEAEIRFYKRLGMLLALWTVLGGGDCHHENIIAQGEHPVVIDAETIFDAYGGGNHLSDKTPIGETISRRIADSVKRVGILPRYLQVSTTSDPIDLSALGMRAPIPMPTEGEDGYAADARVLGIASSAAFVIQPRANMPRDTNEALGSARIAAIRAGLEELYDVVIRNKQRFLERLKGCRSIRNARVRMVMRQTNVYSRLLEQSLYPEYLRWGIRRSIEIDRLSKRYTEQHFSRLNSELCVAEVRALEALDIPLFDVPLCSSSRKPVSCDEHGGLSRPPKGDPLRAAIARVKGACNEDKYFQSKLIEEILLLDDALKYPTSSVVLKTATSVASPKSPSPTIEDVERTIFEIEQEVTGAAVINPREEMGWLAPTPTSSDGCYEHRWAGYGLYAGSTGIAIMYAALFKAFHDYKFRERAIASLSALNLALSSRKKTNTRYDLELLRDAYGLVIASKLLNEPAIIEPLLSFVRNCDASMLAYDSKFDVLGGGAGALLTLIALYYEFPSDECLEIARMIGDHLLAHRVVVNAQSRAWVTLDAPLAGFAHGVSGIALALSRLNEITDDGRYLDAATEALTYESALFSPAEGNWPDLRNASEKQGNHYEACGWCHGATGIGLARLALRGRQGCSNPNIESTRHAQDVARARQATLLVSAPPVDHLCCGIMGRATFLDLLTRYNNDTLAGATRDRIVGALISQPVKSWKMINGVREFVMVPGFFNGLAGVGYELLRMYVDPSLPCVLTWDSVGK
jgi:type 2 lantibiotic biosynthesis protein LanM